GEAYVIYGKNVAVNGDFSPQFDLSSLNGSNGFKISGIEALSELGWHIHNAGDINNDGVDDLIIGAPGASPNGQLMAGQSFIVFGSAIGFSSSFDLSTLDGTNGFIIDGLQANDLLGRSVSAAGDVNNDGIDDIIIGAPGAGNGTSYVIFGKDTSVDGHYDINFDLSTLDGTN